MSEGPVITLPNMERDKLVAAIEEMKRTLPMMIEFHQLDAKVRRAKYDALVAEGFHPIQALELCK